jgi:hypothetical protein
MSKDLSSTAPSSLEDSEDFDAAFDQLANDRDGRDGQTPEPPAPSNPGTDMADVNAPDSAAVGDIQSAQHESAPSDTNQADDIWAGAPAHLREAYEAQRRDAEQNAFKVARLSKQVSVQDRQLHSIQRGASDGDRKASANQVKALLNGEQMTQFKDDYPEIADVFLPVMQAQADELNRVREQTLTIEQVQEGQDLQVQFDTFRQLVPDYTELAGRAELADWVATQPRHIREAYGRNAENIVDAEEAADVLNRFKQTLGESTQDTASTPKTDPRRARQMEGARSVRTPGFSPSATGISDDFDTAFDQLAKQREARRKR